MIEYLKKQNEDGTFEAAPGLVALVRDKTYDKVIKRMTPFFKKDNYRSC